MTMSRRNWSRQETLMALAFYLCPPLPRKNWDDGDAEIQLLAGEIGRTESAVCFKIASLKACDRNRGYVEARINRSSNLIGQRERYA